MTMVFFPGVKYARFLKVCKLSDHYFQDYGQPMRRDARFRQ